MFKMMFSRRWWWTTLIVLAGIGLTIRLGFWQLDRHEQRQSRIGHITAVQELPVLDLNMDPLPTNLETMEYRQVTATGEYDFDHQVALRNQVRPRMTGNDPGFTLITPLLLEDGSAVMVERGWIPKEYDTASKWRQFDEPGTVRVAGVIRISMEKGEMGSALVDPTLAPGESRLDTWNFVNLPRLQEQVPYPILDIYIEQAPGVISESLPFRQQVPPDLDPGAHIGFALQWFFYAALLIFGYPVWLKKQRPA